MVVTCEGDAVRCWTLGYVPGLSDRHWGQPTGPVLPEDPLSQPWLQNAGQHFQLGHQDKPAPIRTEGREDHTCFYTDFAFLNLRFSQSQHLNCWPNCMSPSIRLRSGEFRHQDNNQFLWYPTPWHVILSCQCLSVVIIAAILLKVLRYQDVWQNNTHYTFIWVNTVFLLLCLIFRPAWIHHTDIRSTLDRMNLIAGLLLLLIAS